MSMEDKHEQVSAEKHTYELNVERIKTIDDVKVVLKSLGIKYTKEALNKDLKKLVR